MYLKIILDSHHVDNYADALIKSKNGLVVKFADRVLVPVLAKKSHMYDCIILGSSRIKQISSLRNTGNIQNKCKKILNLGMGGAGLEDVSALSYILLNNSKIYPKEIFINIDPWTLKFNMDKRYIKINSYYQKMNELLELNSRTIASYNYLYLTNLINMDYFKTSIRILYVYRRRGLSHIIENRPFLEPTEVFTYDDGYTKPILLPDASLVRSADYIKKCKKSIDNYIYTFKENFYKISDEVYDENALLYLNKLIKLFQKNRVKVNLIMSPYHSSTTKEKQWEHVKSMKKVTELVNELAEENNLEVYGSYFSDELRCTEKEFFDFQHPTIECMNRIDFSK